ncbi:MAG: PLP-dependent aminotransferase family protein [Eubacteriales bacterium]
MIDLVIPLNTNREIPLYEQIYSYIKEDIQKGNLVCGQRLPSSRKLALSLEVSRSTVELSYEQLVSEGYLETIPCKGYYVAEIEELYQFTNELKQNQKTNNKKAENKQIEVEREEELYQYDFTPNGIDLENFPYNAWRKISKNILLDDKSELFVLGNSQGEYEFRDTICQYLHQARGMECEPEQVVVGAGNEYLLMLLSTIIGQHNRVAFENPTYERAYHVFKNLSHEVFSINMDRHGMNMAELEETEANIAYVMPSHQFPTGVIMPIKRRLELLKWACIEEERYIIEDDYDSEFRYKGKPIPALQGYDTQDKVIYLGTFSKSIAPAIRMSYMVLPKKLVGVYRGKCQFLSSTVSKVDQMIVNSFLKEGYYERHLNKMRAMYKNKHDTLLSELKPLIQQGICKVKGENAGVHILIEFTEGYIREYVKKFTEEHIENYTIESMEDLMVESVKQHGVKVYGLSQYYSNKSKLKYATIILGYATLSEKDIKEATQLFLKSVDNGMIT